jgi:hypothetical protein
MKLYHGSNVEIESIDLARGRRGKDFGKGFYANPDYMQAVEFCSNVVRREGSGIPTVTSFEFDESGGKHYINKLRFEIMEVYSGTKYQDTVISEIYFTACP